MSGVAASERLKESGCEAVMGEDVGSENASRVDMARCRREFVLLLCDENRFDHQPMLDSAAAGRERMLQNGGRAPSERCWR